LIPFDVAGALKAGYSSTEVLDHLAAQNSAPVTAEGLAKQAGVGVVKGGIGHETMK
jgi:hypothetical protein